MVTTPQTYDQDVGARMRALRRRYHVTQAQLAARLGVDMATISRYERGERAMTVAMLVRVADQFAVAASPLLPTAHQAAAAEPPAATPVAAPAPDVLGGLPHLEAGAIQSIVQVRATQPQLIVPVMAAIEQDANAPPHAAG